MHISGKIALGLIVVVLAPAAILLTTMSLDIRSKWQAEVEQRQEKLTTSTDQLDKIRTKVANLEGEYQQKTFAWGEVWDAPQSVPLAGQNGIQIGVGRSSGLGRSFDPAKPPRIYAFAENGDASTYIGEFELDQLDADRAAGRLLRPAYPGEAQSWPQGKYHVRDTLPSNWLSTVADLEAQLILIGTKFRMQQEQESLMTKQLAASQVIMDQRLAELNGDADAPMGASQQVLDGLVETLRKLEDERNLVLSDVHDLRVKLVKDYIDLETSLEKNRNLVDSSQSDASARKPALAGQ
ncbi:hypothetical protein [Thalassoglobus polymorphus]|uniref:Uncharacterized protein n=1 Tax=Thalassoglobus polymorphus TaxID=2527994 RepID=A0A517QN90_9PLAN|nr:hypothetical protein [Thalassoglobus polymorphus]QDT33102.1 hypothetical protein Mal48_23540 [Thalassoglobus polymorphus]